MKISRLNIYIFFFNNLKIEKDCWKKYKSFLQLKKLGIIINTLIITLNTIKIILSKYLGYFVSIPKFKSLKFGKLFLKKKY